MKHMESVKELRPLIEGRNNPVEKEPGVYRWWFKRDKALELLKSYPNLDVCRLQTHEIAGEVYVALYFGISKDMKQRAKWHVCQHHIPSAVSSGFLSTLRQTLSALLKVDMSKSEDAVNIFMDKNCYWEWDYTATLLEAKGIEHSELTQSEYCYPLNIQGNKTVSVQWLELLKEMRKMYNK